MDKDFFKNKRIPIFTVLFSILVISISFILRRPVSYNHPNIYQPKIDFLLFKIDFESLIIFSFITLGIGVFLCLFSDDEKIKKKLDVLVYKLNKGKSGFNKSIIESRKDEILVIESGLMVHASQGRRFFAFLIDLLIAMMIVLLAFQLFGEGETNKKVELYLVIPMFLIHPIYWFYFEYKYGFTIGKKIFKIKVVKNNSENITKLTSIIRTVSKVILSGGLFPLFFFLWLFDKENRWVHDHISRTYVIKTL